MTTETTPPVRPSFSLHRIVVPLDFSAPSANALQTAAGLAEKFGAELILLHVVPVMQYAEYTASYQGFVLAGVDFAKMEVDARRDADERLAPLVRELQDRGIKARGMLRHGEAAQEILLFAETEQADVIVIATHGYSGFKHFLLGSVTERVIRHAPCPVFVVRLKESEAK